MIGPESAYSELLHATKYRGSGETFDDYCIRYARATTKEEEHFRDLLDALRNQRVLPAGRQQLAVGRAHQITASNCFVMNNIHDSMDGIMTALKESAATLRTGGGIGVDFSSIRPKGDTIEGLGLKAYASGPVSFMKLWNTMSSTIMSAGHRRGAMMGSLRIDHPSIMEFVSAKQNQDELNNFNISVAVTDEFMEALDSDGLYKLKFKNRTYEEVRATDVWARIMERNWDWAEPGVLFIDRMNRMNPLNYCEKILTVNPCGEMPLPPYGNCLLGSLNIPKYLIQEPRQHGQLSLLDTYSLDYNLMKKDINTAVSAFDTVIDITYYPLAKQLNEAESKRQIGLGVTGMANALEIMGYPYASPDYIQTQSKILEFIRDEAYTASIWLAELRGPFPLFNAEGWLNSGFAKTLPNEIRASIRRHGLRNGRLLSIAPTGTISQCADNISSGIEPPFSLKYKRQVYMNDTQQEYEFIDYAYAKHQIKGKTAHEVTPQEHINVLAAAQKYVDSSVSKTCNVNGLTPDGRGGVSFDQFKNIYLQAYTLGCKAVSTFNINGSRNGLLRAEVEEPQACILDPETGIKSCDS